MIDRHEEILSDIWESAYYSRSTYNDVECTDEGDKLYMRECDVRTALGKIINLVEKLIMEKINEQAICNRL